MAESSRPAVPDQGLERHRLVVVAHDIGQGGGMEKVHAELIRRLSGAWDIAVISSTLDSELCPLVTWHRVRVPSRPMALKFSAFFILAGLRLGATRGKVVHTCGAIIPRRATVASVHLCHVGLVKATGRLGPAEAPLARRVNTGLQRLLALAAERWCYRLKRLQVLHAVSAGVAQEMEQHFPGVPVTVIPNGLDTERFKPDGQSRTAVRREYGIPEGALAVLFVGGDWHRKGLRLAIEGLAQARRLGADGRLWIVGPGDERRFQGYAEQAGVASSVRFFGPVEDTSPFYRAADVLVLPSQYEADPLVAHEAAACGLPILATAVHGIVDLVGHDEAGLIVGRDPDELSAALVRLAGDAPYRRSLGAEARRRTMAMTWDVMASRLDELLRSLVPPPPEEVIR